MTTPLRSRQHEVADALEANELFQANGWTDGLPIVRPTEARVRHGQLCSLHRGERSDPPPDRDERHAQRPRQREPGERDDRPRRPPRPVNLLGAVPGALDRSTLGHPGKFTLSLAEDEEDSSWRPLAQERGVPDGVSAVTVLACASPRQVMNEWTRDPENGKVNVGPFLDHVEAILRTGHGVRAVVRRRKADISAPADAGTLAALAASDGVISAVGD